MCDWDRPIGVFDSGLGGLSVLRELVRLMPEENYLYFGDSAHAPYGPRPTQEIRELTLRAAKDLFDKGAKALVVACNTATSAAINHLREIYPDKIIVGIEPALKPAVDQNPHGRILVMATDATLREEKFSALMARCAADCEIIKCPCPKLVEFVEQGQLEGEEVLGYLREILKDCTPKPLDGVVLGCTHYPFLKKAIREVVGPRPAILDGGCGTAKETRRRLEAAGLLRKGGPGKVELTNSLPSSEICLRGEHLLNITL